jgi:hypothetical protein
MRQKPSVWRMPLLFPLHGTLFRLNPMFEQMFERLFAILANVVLRCQRGKEVAHTV